jgi:hypothetical protein
MIESSTNFHMDVDDHDFARKSMSHKQASIYHCDNRL